MSLEKPGFCQRVVDAVNIRPDKVAMMVIEPKTVQTVTFGSVL